jgi:hypothetical protein
MTQICHRSAGEHRGIRTRIMPQWRNVFAANPPAKFKGFQAFSKHFKAFQSKKS